MVRCIDEDVILRIIRDKNLLGKKQITSLKAIIEEAIIDNEIMIDILYENKILPLISNISYIKIYNYSYIQAYVVHGYFIYEDGQGNKITAINDLKILFSHDNFFKSIMLIKKYYFYKLLEKNFSHLTSIKAKYALEFKAGSIIAKNINYANKVIIFFAMFIATLIYLPTLFHIVNNISYCLQNILKSLLFVRAASMSFPRKRESSQTYKKQVFYRFILSRICNFCTKIKVILLDSHFRGNDIEECRNDVRPYIYDEASTIQNHKASSQIAQNEKKALPIYTILVPLYKELSKLRSIIKNISLINYPKDKLDVKIIIKDDDYLMIKELALYNLPSYFHVIFVPKSLPRTKPKALNYALEYSRGEYLVVYDAEDKPETDQLLKALAMFRNLPSEYVCLQAKLNFYNKNENVLTKLFNIEYSLWFEYILKGLSLLKLPTPLGGTSNHFKTDILNKLGGWDAYNVTEDAELGIRIYSQNYKVAILDSYTLEEAPNSLGNWLNQRSRWIKGFLQTFFVFKARKDKYRKFTLLQVITIYIFIGLSTYNFWSLPFIIFSIAINKNSIINYLWLINSIFSLLYLYSTALYILKNSLKSGKVKFQDIVALVLWGSYFILHTIASYKAVFEIIFCPFKWSKTKHGTSLEDFEQE
ncbi:glycosyltransferase family 2 protein [Rickettsia felis]|nr:glycosyltransferase family 2 protein [Rickettsia felis]